MKGTMKEIMAQLKRCKAILGGMATVSDLSKYLKSNSAV